MTGKNFWAALASITLLGFISLWCLQQTSWQDVSVAHIKLSVGRSDTGGVAAVQLSIRARLPADRLGRELLLHQGNLQEIFANTAVESLMTASKSREVRRQVLSELSPIGPIVGLSWEISVVHDKDRKPNPDVLDLLRQSPGTLSYADQAAQER